MEIAFEESELPYTVDVVDLNAVSQGFRQIVEAQRVPLPLASIPGKVNRVWRKVTLGEVAELNDATYSPKEVWPFVNYLDTGNITENRISEIQHLVAGTDKIPSRARRKVENRDIVYSTVRPNQKHFGLMRDIPENFLVSTGFAVIRGKAGVACTDFLYWFLAQDHIVEYLHSIAENSTSAYPSIRPSDLEQLTVPLPPLPEQRAIAHVLGALDDKIELNRRMNRTLEQMARAVFQDWFVDFGPVRANLAGRWQYGQSLPGMPAELYDLFPDRLVASEIGEMPEGWEIRTLESELEALVSGQRPRGGAVAEGVPSIGAENIIGLGHYDFAKTKYVPPDFFSRLKAKGSDVRNGDVLLYKDGAKVGRKAYFDCGFPYAQCAINEHVFILRLRDQQAQRYLFFWLDQRWITEEIIALNSNSAQPGINRTGVRGLPFLVPPSDVLTAFDSSVGVLTDQIFANCHQSRILAALRDALLQRLLSGELRIPDTVEALAEQT